MLRPENLLDLVRNLVVFERDAATGQTIRKLCRDQQFAAVSKAIARAPSAKSATERGGVVWHTQGSGKSLTMLWLALKLRRDPAHENPTIVLVTDRKDLDTQITKTFRACGFPNPEQAESVRDLRELLSGPTGKTISLPCRSLKSFKTATLRERLEQIIEDGKAKRIDAAQQLKLFEALTKELRAHSDAAEKIGLSETAFAIYGLVTEPKPMTLSDPGRPGYATVDEAKKELASLLEELLEPHAAIVDWAHKEDVQREMRRLIKKQLKAASYPVAKIDSVAESVVELLKRRSGR
jgi:type I site-specific restriction-modification system R (restriction) subunit